MKDIREIKSLTDWVIEFLDNRRKFGRGERYDANVECGSCKACCYHYDVYVDPNDEPVDSLAIMQVVHDGHGWLIPKREDDSCIHLTDQGCGIYQHRPVTCRTYDCRIFSACSLPMNDWSDRDVIKPPLWQINPKTPGELIFALLAFRNAQRLTAMGAAAEIGAGLALAMTARMSSIVEQAYARLDQNTQRSIMATHKRVFRSIQQQIRIAYLAKRKPTLAVSNHTFEFLSDYEWLELEAIVNGVLAVYTKACEETDFNTGLAKAA